MSRRLKTAAVLAVTIPAALTPSPTLAAAKAYLIKNDDRCLTYAVDRTPAKLGFRAQANYCPSTEFDGYLWKRTARSQLAVTYQGRTYCLGTPKGTAVQVGRCGSDLKRQQFAFPVVKEGVWDTVVQIKWKHLRNTCLYHNPRRPWEISAAPCLRTSSDQHWVMVRR
ncbi:hypothetical protein ACFLIM_40035 [Nonomuraea sp. M3C6]|uniref:Ricin B lectin domain-containing protein n=1 Tax=Nonomuraea marmarensis TaxID=3351344 RepID=A0ABW7APR0_9ACTN